MTDDEKYFFDLQGYLVIPDVLNADELRRANEAIDANLASVSHSHLQPLSVASNSFAAVPYTHLTMPTKA